MLECVGPNKMQTSENRSKEPLRPRRYAGTLLRRRQEQVSGKLNGLFKTSGIPT